MAAQLPSQELSALLRSLYDVEPKQLAQSRQLKSLQNANVDNDLLLASIPATAEPSARPLHLLYTLLTTFPGRWSTFNLIRAQTRLAQCLPESSKARGDGELDWVIGATADIVKRSYNGFSDFLEHKDSPALRATNGMDVITHRGLHDFVSNFNVPTKQTSSSRKPVVAIALPNGPLLAATCVAVTTYYTAAPINPAAGAEQFRADILQAGADVILTTAEDLVKLQLRDPWVAEKGIKVLLMEWKDGDNIQITDHKGHALSATMARPQPNRADDIGLILFTSGTSGTKKVVPLTTHSMVAGIVFVMDSWGLSTKDICLNMMPLYHVGGLVRNIFAPIFSGGSTVCCTAFDPNMFWDVVDEIQPTWYYASPSMHSVILSEAESRPAALQKSRIRLACNAAGGLLPSLAYQLRDTFHCVVLPSYGMTECMPISTPPLNYRLDREGTSGISTGPELTILDWSEKQAETGAVGRICVRGEPVFPGYLRPDGSFDKSPFNANGWFDTGDLGYMDADGYLYITGRSKEVINRGGELISPFEVENAIMSAALSEDSPISGRVKQVLAFSATHDVLQEVVAVALVCPSDLPLVDLKTLHSALRSSLQQVKWPTLITYMNDLPKKNNKVLRIKLGQRLDLPDISDDMPYLQRHWQAKCPPPDSALTVMIPSTVCTVDFSAISAALDVNTPADYRHYCRESPLDGSVEAFLAPASHNAPTLEKEFVAVLKQNMSSNLHGFAVPDQIHLMQSPFPRDYNGNVDVDALQRAVDEIAKASMAQLGQSIEGKVTKVFAEVLGRSYSDIPVDADFFALGGDSLKAGKLVSGLRTAFHVHLPISIVFTQGTVAAIAAHVDKLVESSSEDEVEDYVVGCEETYSSTNFFLMLLQLVPMCVVYPFRRGTQWTIFIACLSYSQSLYTNDFPVGRLVNLTVSIMIARVAIRMVAPFFGILCKWLIMGRYREGLYPMWGSYHTRWWLTEKILAVSGKGFFGVTNFTNNFYYRLLGAKIGANVSLGKAQLGEFDLLDIRDGVSLDKCTIRPFAAEGNTSMYLGRIIIGQNSTVGTASIISAGSEIPANTCIGPNSSSWEVEDADEFNRDLMPGRRAKPHWLLLILFTIPLYLVSWFLGLVPWLGGLVGMVATKPSNDGSPLRGILDWFTHPNRVGYHYLALVLRASLSPFFVFFFVVLLKKVLDAFCGQLTPNSTHQSTVTTWRANLTKTLLPIPALHGVTGMFGQHYEATSVFMRMLGAKIGKRVYWPGTGPSIGDYHLLDIGNDVVFGSRSHLNTSDGYGSYKITIGDRAMIADRVNLLAGVQVGERTTMGSGALTRRGHKYNDEGTYVGSKGGDAVCLSSGRDEKSAPARMHHMSSDDTLSGQHERKTRNLNVPQIHHLSSDDTLAGRGATPGASIKQDPFRTPAGSDSDSNSERNMSTPTSDVSPFGRAFYLKLASYHVMGPFAIFCYSTFITVFTAFYWNVPSISSIQIVNSIFQAYLPYTMGFWANLVVVWGMTCFFVACLTTAEAILALTVVIASKWILLGRRQPGNYDWDKSPYCQRWQLFLCIEKLRRQCYRGHGILGMLTGTHWLVMYFRSLGANIGKDCALFANGRPSLMFTEPDLIKLGDRVTVDDASVVAHINTRGKFDLNRLEIGDRCVLRTGSRLLSGATMKDDSCLLEHTLIMGGDVVEAKSTMQGWPAERFKGARVRA